MTIKRLILIVLTFIAIAQVFLSLGDSLSQPQIQSRLELYQTNLVLNAAEFKVSENIEQKIDISSEEEPLADLTITIKALIGDNPYLAAQKQHQKALQFAQTNLSNLQTQLQEVSSKLTISSDILKQQQKLEQTIAEEEKFISQLNLKLGILEIQEGETETALATWNDLIKQYQREANQKVIAQTAEVLKALWSPSQRLLPETESQIEDNLDGWFRYITLKKLYQVQERQDKLLNLQAKEQEIAIQALFKLAIIGGLPVFGGMIGIGLLIFVLVQFLLQGDRSLLAYNSNVGWETPWDGETVWQVLIVGFFFIGQILLPILFGLSGFNPTGFSLRLKAIYVLFSYLLMASGGILVLYFSLKPFFPLPKEWFRFQWLSNWFLWGIGGYLVALPVVVLVSLINQQLWQGQGGSNPILFLALQAQDRVALAIFFFTASIAAPLFEELVFRGFLLPSLTRYLPVWSSIVISSFVFSIAHLSLSEVLPLTALGMILGFVYTKSRNLLAPMLLHSLWNSGTLLSLFVLGSS